MCTVVQQLTRLSPVGSLDQSQSTRVTDGQNYDSQDRASIAASRGKTHFFYSAQLLNRPTDLDGGCDQHCLRPSEVYDTHRRTKLTAPETISRSMDMVVPAEI